MEDWIAGGRLMPNKSPEPTVVGAVSSAIAVHVASLRWLSFLRCTFQMVLLKFDDSKEL